MRDWSSAKGKQVDAPLSSKTVPPKESVKKFGASVDSEWLRPRRAIGLNVVDPKVFNGTRFAAQNQSSGISHYVDCCKTTTTGHWCQHSHNRYKTRERAFNITGFLLDERRLLAGSGRSAGLPKRLLKCAKLSPKRPWLLSAVERPVSEHHITDSDDSLPSFISFDVQQQFANRVAEQVRDN
jgi:hypothetical protein